MAPRTSTISMRFVALIAAIAVILGLSACQASEPEPSPSSSTGVGIAHANVAIFTPSDGITISQHTPLNKWAKLVPELTKALDAEGFSTANITTSTSNDLDEQSAAIQDYVVSSIAGQTNGASSTGNDESLRATPSATASSTHQSQSTLIVAPATTPDQVTRQFGDYITWPLTWSTKDDSSGDSSQTDAATRKAGDRLVSALKLAKSNGIHVVVLANPIQGFTPDLFVQLSTASTIGRIQAQKLVSKLALDKTSKDNPKSVEVLLPYAPDQHDDDKQAQSIAQESFAGIWEVLGPYFKDGRAVSPSNTLTASTTDKDWRDVAFAATTSSQVQQELASRLHMDDKGDAHTDIDGVIALNDFVASGVTTELSKLGYVGSAADINPQITISGIVGNMTGKRDLAKASVPDPVKKPQSPTTSEKDDAKAIETLNSRWPIVTGYGAYIDVIPQIVDGEQWMTALEDRDAITKNLSAACAQLSTGASLDKLDTVDSLTIDGAATPTIKEQLLAVSASNLKQSLIDPGYIALADAGL